VPGRPFRCTCRCPIGFDAAVGAADEGGLNITVMSYVTGSTWASSPAAGWAAPRRHGARMKEPNRELLKRRKIVENA